ncbi:MAG: small multi-drug export protein [Lachnospiraceae bacterium]|nr:small multi-drug export protein [Lachnospiraceae bacterium]
MLRHYLYVFFISMVPIIELRGAIPIAQVFHESDPAFNMVLAYILIAIGNMIPVPFIFFFARRVLEWGADKPGVGRFFSWCLNKGHKGGEKLKETAGKGLYWALLIFVGIPLPGTGAWTGTLAASFLDMDFKKSVIAVMGGVALAGCIMAVLSWTVAAGVKIF